MYGQATKTAVLLLSVPPLLDQCLLYLHPIHVNVYPQLQLVIVLIRRPEWVHQLIY